MANSGFPSLVTGVTVETATTGALSGDGSSGDKLAVGVDGVTIAANGSNQLAYTFKSSDGSSGITQSVTTASLVGKTLSFKNGICTGFA